MSDLYNTIKKENIIFKNSYINENTKGICIRLPNSKTAIVINKSKIENSIEEKCVLAEELRTLLLRRFILSVLCR